jgi:3',5'-cyclic AMP phosphodiesterase CpdA
MPTFALIADVHLRAEPTVQSDRLAAVLADLDRCSPDFVLFLGDVTADGRPESYHHFLRLLDLTDLKCHFVRGNNENQGPGDTRFFDFLGKHWHAFEWEGWHFVCLDTTEHPMSDAQWTWLGGVLTANGRGPTVLFGHHYLEVLDEVDRSRLLDSLGRGQYVCAHQHLDRTDRFGSVEQRVLTCLDPAKPKQGVAGYCLVTPGPSGLQLELVPAPTARLGSPGRWPRQGSGCGP